MKQYMEDKPTKGVYKVFVLADAQPSFTFNFFMYQGKSETTKAHGLIVSTVCDQLPFQKLSGGYTPCRQ